jgi:D-serine deaminase-like pyridoxal phosphate-dependent protein
VAVDSLFVAEGIARTGRLCGVEIPLLVELDRGLQRTGVCSVDEAVELGRCACTNLHNQVYGVRNGIVEVVWDVAARGMVR